MPKGYVVSLMADGKILRQGRREYTLADDGSGGGMGFVSRPAFAGGEWEDCSGIPSNPDVVTGNYESSAPVECCPSCGAERADGHLSTCNLAADMTRPCPFCGAEEGLHEYKQWPGYRCVACQRCGTNCTADLWNERPIEDALLAEVMQLRAALERIRDRDCLGNGRVWAASAMAPAYSTEPCPACGGTGHWVPGNAAEVAELALKISDLSRKGKSDGS